MHGICLLKLRLDYLNRVLCRIEQTMLYITIEQLLYLWVVRYIIIIIPFVTCTFFCVCRFIIVVIFILFVDIIFIILIEYTFTFTTRVNITITGKCASISSKYSQIRTNCITLSSVFDHLLLHVKVRVLCEFSKCLQQLFLIYILLMQSCTTFLFTLLITIFFIPFGIYLYVL